MQGQFLADFFTVPLFYIDNGSSKLSLVNVFAISSLFLFENSVYKGH